MKSGISSLLLCMLNRSTQCIRFQGHLIAFLEETLRTFAVTGIGSHSLVFAERRGRDDSDMRGC